MVGEIKKQKYIYYHCTGYADKCRGEPASCRRKYVREEVLEKQFTAMLGQLRFDDEVLEWVREALHASHADERQEHEAAIKRLQAEHRRLGERISAMYVDKLDGKIGGDFFDKMAGQWRDEQRRLQNDIDRHEEAEQSYMDEGVRILELPAMLRRCSNASPPAKSVACSTSYFRTAFGRMDRWSPPSANPLICWRKLQNSPPVQVRATASIPRKTRFGWEGRTRTCNLRYQKPVLYQLSYFPTCRAN